MSEEGPIAICYICYDSDESQPVLTGICACTSLAVHAKCQEKMLRFRQNSDWNCGVCRQPFANVELKDERIEMSVKQLNILNTILIVVTFHGVGAFRGCKICSFLLVVFVPMYVLLNGCMQCANWVTVPHARTEVAGSDGVAGAAKLSIWARAMNATNRISSHLGVFIAASGTALLMLTTSAVK